MTRALQRTFTVLLVAVLIGKILGWVFNFREDINLTLSTAMFVLIGIAYIVMAFVWSNKLLQSIILTCGMFLIVMNFVNNNITINILGIVCILTPMLVARFDKEKDGRKSRTNEVGHSS